MKGIIMALVAAAEFVLAVLSAAKFESTDDPRMLLITGAAMVVTIVVLVIMHTKEELK